MKALAGSQPGLALIELLISLALAGLLIAGTLQLLSAARVGWQVQDSLARLQESARHAHHYLSHDLRQAGDFGCGRRGALHSAVDVAPGDFLRDFVAGPVVEGADSVLALPDSAGLETDDEYAADNEVLVIRGGVPADSFLAPVSPARPPPLYLRPTRQARRLDRGDLLAWSDCRRTVIAPVARVVSDQGALRVVMPDDATPGGASPPAPRAGVVEVNTRIYFLATGPAGEPALYRRSGTKPAEELVSGVERMAVRYGIDRTGNGVLDRYETAGAVTDWSRVISVRVTLLLRAPHAGVRGAPEELHFPGVADPLRFDDGRLRDMVRIGVSLRNPP